MNYRQRSRGISVSDGISIDANTQDKTVSRDQVVAAIYETVISPGQFESFLEIWAQHVQESIQLPEVARKRGVPLEDLEGASDLERPGQDAELQQHFARAYQILDQLGRKAPQVDLLDRVRRADGLVVALSPMGKVVAASHKGHDWIGDGQDAAEVKERINPHSAQLLDDLLNAVRDETAITGPPIVLTAEGAPRHLVARLVRSGGDGQALFAERQRHVLIEAMDFQWSDQAEQMLVTSFGLTRAEVEVVRLLMSGLSLRQVAVAAGKSEHTVRNQLKSVLSKTGAPGQVELIRLVAFLVNEELRVREAAGHLHTLCHDVRTAADGRKLQIFHAGAPEGTPLIFLHGMLDATASLQFLSDRLITENYRVYAPMRPGFGQSDPVIRPETAMDVITDQIVELITRERLRKPLILVTLLGVSTAIFWRTAFGIELQVWWRLAAARL